MLRLISTLAVSVALLLGAGLWFGRDPAREAPPDGRPSFAERALGVATEGALGAAREASETIAALAEATPPPPVAKPATEPTPAGRSQAPSAPPSFPSGEVDGGAVHEVVLTATGHEPFREGPLDEGPEAAPPGSVDPADVSPAEPDGFPPGPDVLPPDPDEWAALIRRMLAVYQRVSR